MNKEPTIARKFQNSEKLIEKLILLLDASFDAMNGRSKKNAISKESKDPRYQWDNCESVCPSALIKNQCFNLLLFQRIFLGN